MLNRELLSESKLASDFATLRQKFGQHQQELVCITAINDFVDQWGELTFLSLYPSATLNYLGAIFLPLCVAIHLKQKHLVRTLLDLGVSANEVIRQATTPTFDNMTALMLAVESGILLMVKDLLRHQADMFFVTSNGQSVMMKQNAMTAEICKLLIVEAKLNHTIIDLLSLKDVEGDTAFESACRAGKFKNFHLMFKVEGLEKKLNMRRILDSVRNAAWSYPNAWAEFNAICLALRKYVLKPDPMSYKDANPVTQKSKYTNLFGSLPVTNLKENVINKVLAQFSALLSNISACEKYLKFIDTEFARYFREKHGKSFPTLPENGYQFLIIDSYYFPIPTRHFQGVKKFSALQEYLISLFKKYDLAESMKKLIAFIPPDIINRFIKRGDFFTENRIGVSLYHGKVTHMLQLAMLLLAIESNEISLDANIKGARIKITINDIFEQLISSKNLSQNSLFSQVCDMRYVTEMNFTDPFQLHSAIMYYGKALGFSTLANALIDSFCKGYQVYRAASASIYPLTPEGDRKFLEDQNDLGIEDFSMPSSIYKFILEREVEKGRLMRERVEMEGKYQVVNKYYKVNQLFQPAKMDGDKITSSLVM